MLTVLSGQLFLYVLDSFLSSKSSISFVLKYNILFLIILFLVFLFILFRFLKLTKRLFFARRLDVILSFLFSIFVLLEVNKGLFNNLDLNLLNNWSWPNMSLIFFIVFVIVSILLVVNSFYKRTSNKPIFISDDPEGAEDFLNFKKEAYVFAKQILNNGSSNSMVFGIDAPWGIGKSTYLNFCKQYWKEQKDLIIFDFEPLRFEDNTEIFEVFINGLIDTINNKYYYPEISESLNKYRKLLKAVKFSVFNFDFSLPVNISLDNVFKSLKENIKFLDKKIIVLIDDLDRLSFEKVKTILDIVKKSFVLPNVSFVLCYDTNNISEINRNRHEKLIEYSEKVVNIKKTLTNKRSLLKEYFYNKLFTEKDESIGEYFSKNSEESIKEALEVLFNPSNFVEYVNYIGDLRKIKRFINIIKMQVIPNIDFDLTIVDVDFVELFHLILIYINYPDVFRKIYITETDGGRGFFSLEIDYSKSEFNYENSKAYNDYVKDFLPEKLFLLDKLFSKKRLSLLKTRPSPKFEATAACFNGGIFGSGGANLEVYLNLIVDSRIPDVLQSYSFFFQKVKDFSTSKKSIDEIMESFKYEKFYKEEEFENLFSMFLNVLFKNLNDLINFEKASDLIEYILLNIPKFSLLGEEAIDRGLRKRLILDLVSLLDARGWKDNKGKNYNNTEEYIIQIARRILGEGDYADKGIISILSKGRGILGIYDLFLFRLYCSPDRGGDFYNLTRALRYHFNPSSATTNTHNLLDGMREISQKAFNIFKDEYINKSINLFEVIDKLSLDDFYGYYVKYNKNDPSEIEKEELFKNAVISFITYQIANAEIDSGVGCGLYDVKGNIDKKGIRKCMNEYIFNVCFNPAKAENIKYFTNFLLINLVKGFFEEDGSLTPSLSQISKILDKDSLLNYWKQNKDKIIKFSDGKNVVVRTYNYTASYLQHLPVLFELLDNELQKRDGEIANDTGNKVEPKQVV